MTDRIAAALARLFEEHRIVLWYDNARELRAAFEALDLPGVERVEIANNEFGIKYRVLRQESERKFLLYKHGPAPKAAANWLLDLEHAAPMFRADQAELWLTELNLPLNLKPLVEEHKEFFRARARVEALRAAIKLDDGPATLRQRMLLICTGAEGGLEAAIEALLGEFAEDRDEKWRLIGRANLDAFFWKRVGEVYGYRPETPGLEDFALTLFDAATRLALGDTAVLTQQALLLLRRWKDNRTGTPHFKKLSAQFTGTLDIPARLRAKGKDLRAWAGIDHFEEIDRHFIREIVGGLASRTVAPAEATSWVEQRRQSIWWETYADVYQAIHFAIAFQQALAEANLGMTSPADGVRRYAASWFRLDQLYRRFLYHWQKSRQHTLLADLFEAVENHYTTSYLLPLNHAWQDQVAGMETWEISGIPRQAAFYPQFVGELRNKSQKAVVIVSDALRYEVAEECAARIRAQNRFEATLTPMLSALPSYTQLGMAAFLPNQALSLAEGGAVLADGASTQGLAAREARLAAGRGADRVKTLKAEEMLEMTLEEGKTLFRDHDVIYVYHNRIDVVADKRESEDQLADACERAMEDLVTLVRKLTSANVSNIFITADHGFLYQHRPLAESDFLAEKPEGASIDCFNRRFVIGRGLTPTPGVKIWSEAALGLKGDREVAIPNAISRLRVQGSGSRYVHGGASLQEVVVPLLRVSKRREEDVDKVEVQIVVSGRLLISSGQIAVTLYQAQPMTAKRQKRELRVGLYAADGTLISDEHTLTFDFTSENPRERERPCKFLLSRTADAYNNQDVILKLRERHNKTSHYHDHATQVFQLRRGIATDFDF